MTTLEERFAAAIYEAHHPNNKWSDLLRLCEPVDLMSRAARDTRDLYLRLARAVVAVLPSVDVSDVRRFYVEEDLHGVIQQVDDPQGGFVTYDDHARALGAQAAAHAAEKAEWERQTRILAQEEHRDRATALAEVEALRNGLAVANDNNHRLLRMIDEIPADRDRAVREALEGAAVAVEGYKPWSPLTSNESLLLTYAASMIRTRLIPGGTG